MAIGRSSMGKQLTGNKVKKFATGGTTSGTKTATFSTSRSTQTPSISATKAPTYSAFSAKGLTSSDPANVARNRAAAQMYANQAASRGESSGRQNFANARADAPGQIKQIAKRTYQAPPPGYDAAKQGEWNYFKTEMVDAPSSAPVAGTTPRAMGVASAMLGPFGRVPAIREKLAAAAASKSGTAPKKMKSGGAAKAGMRGCGCATKGTKGGKMK